MARTVSLSRSRRRQSRATQLPALGDRVKFSIDGGQAQGSVVFLGPVSFGSGDWVGLRLDEPIGRYDGSVQGVRYFDCADKHGLFIRPQFIISETVDRTEIGTCSEVVRSQMDSNAGGVQICASEVEAQLAKSLKRMAELEDELETLRQAKRDVIAEPMPNWWSRLTCCLCTAPRPNSIMSYGKRDRQSSYRKGSVH